MSPKYAYATLVNIPPAIGPVPKVKILPIAHARAEKIPQTSQNVGTSNPSLTPNANRDPPLPLPKARPFDVCPFSVDANGRSIGGAAVTSVSGTVWGRVDFRRHGLIVLGILTWARDFITPDDLLAKILGPCVAWAIVLGVSWLLILFRRGRDGPTELGTWMDWREGKLVACLLITQLCAASSSRFGGSVLPHVRVLL
jgi:hypothetical protein